jgi:mannose-6-phosphate isomerase-like protein (cupin superfamily)
MGAIENDRREAVPSRESLQALLRDEGLTNLRWWSNGPGDRYGWHAHEYHKVLYCASGSIVFHTRERDVALSPGDRLDLPPGTEHAATVGPGGVTCVEAARYPDQRR